MRNRFLQSVAVAALVGIVTWTNAGAATKTTPAKKTQPVHRGQPVHKSQPVHTGKPVRKSAPVFHLPQGWPKQMIIPRIGVNATIEDLAFNREADVHAPYRWGDVAWYDRTAKPGEVGRSTFFGHLDSTCCPAVFYHLGDLKAGDVVQVAYKNHQMVNFRVLWQGVYLNDKLPVKFMFGRTSEHGLTLITCTGVFHRDGTGYDHKRIIYARLILPNGTLG
ncbi:MAG: class F sortase [Chloroflexota bacterium]